MEKGHLEQNQAAAVSSYQWQQQLDVLNALNWTLLLVQTGMFFKITDQPILTVAITQINHKNCHKEPVCRLPQLIQSEVHLLNSVTRVSLSATA